MGKKNNTLKTQNIEALKPADFERIKVDKTQQVVFESDSKDIKDIEKELRELDKKELIYRLNFEESDPKIIKLIKEILKSK